MIDKEKQSGRRVTHWLKANLVFLTVTTFLIIAAVFSVTFAYKRGQAPAASIDQAENLNAAVPKPAEEADLSQDQHDSENSSQASDGTSGHSRQAETLGRSVNCPQIESNEAAKLNKNMERLKEPASLEEVQAFNTAAKDLYNAYEYTIKSRGCNTTLSLQDVLKEGGTNLPQ